MEVESISDRLKWQISSDQLRLWSSCQPAPSLSWVPWCHRQMLSLSFCSLLSMHDTPWDGDETPLYKPLITQENKFRWKTTKLLHRPRSSISQEVLIVSRNSAYFHLDRSYFLLALASLWAVTVLLLLRLGVSSSTPPPVSSASLTAISWSRRSCSLCSASLQDQMLLSHEKLFNYLIHGKKH